MIEKSFLRVVGLPCWGVHWDPQLNLSLNFGRPHLVIREPRSTREPSAKVRLARSHRLVVVRGQWWLWIYCAYWKLAVRGAAPVTGASSRRVIERAIGLLDGQRFERVAVDPRNGKTEFAFDLGARLSVRRFDARNDEELWILYEPNGRVLAVRGDGHYTHQKGSQPDRYLPLP